jgi:hypothetical protein
LRPIGSGVDDIGTDRPFGSPVPMSLRNLFGIEKSVKHRRRESVLGASFSRTTSFGGRETGPAVGRLCAASLAGRMAKKPRTPPPPRRVQAPKKREEHRSAEDRRKLLLLVAFAALGLVALAAVIAVLALTGGGSNGDSDAADVRAAITAAGCTYTEAQAKPLASGGVHVATIDTPVKWNTYPPAAGPHYGQTAVWGFYEQAAEPIRIVHNEEHGGVILWWGPQTPASEISQLRAFYNESPQAMLGTQLGTIDGKSLGSKVAITAWTGDPDTYTENGDYGTGHVAICQKFDEQAFKTFRDAFRGKGPEGIAVSMNQPGT